jgi:hypothetical protein
MRELQAIFEAPPRVRSYRALCSCRYLTARVMQYGKSLNWTDESYTTHDVASVFRRYLTQMPVRHFVVDRYRLLISTQEPVIPHDLYHSVSRTSAPVQRRVKLKCSPLTLVSRCVRFVLMV